MGVGFDLVNFTKKETICFLSLPVSTAREIAGHPAAAAIVTWYLVQNRGDAIAFLPDSGTEWPFDSMEESDISSFNDRTKETLEELIEQEVLVDCGQDYVDEDDPDICLRDIRNCWMPANKMLPS